MQQSTNPKKPQFRYLRQRVDGQSTSDGGGVKLTRLIGQPALDMLDPFLMLDVMRSDRPGDYVAGFPTHPHRGFEAVSYLLAGRVRHRDSAGNEGMLEPGGVQWMTAGRGIEHSEVPEQVGGLLHGFQLWINLPAAHKMIEPAYQEFSPEQVPLQDLDGGVRLRVLAGRAAEGVEGPVRQPLTDPLYLDVELPPSASFRQSIPDSHNAFIFVIDGSIHLPDERGVEQTVEEGQLAVLAGDGDLTLSSADENSRCLLLAGRPLNEPVARGGPFVMNTQAQIRQAYRDYQSGLMS